MLGSLPSSLIKTAGAVAVLVTGLALPAAAAAEPEEEKQTDLSKVFANFTSDTSSDDEKDDL